MAKAKKAAAKKAHKTTKARAPAAPAKAVKKPGGTARKAVAKAKPKAAAITSAKGSRKSTRKTVAAPARAKTPAKKRLVRAAPKWEPQPRIPFAELQARKEVVMRALDDVHQLMVEADPVNAPADFKEREKKAFALLEEINSLVPPSKPMTDKERARLEKELEDKPDDDTLRAMLLEMEKMVDDPQLPLELRALISREQIQDALRSLDEVALLTPIVHKIHTFLDDLRNPKPHDPRAAAMRLAIEQEAARRRS